MNEKPIKTKTVMQKIFISLNKNAICGNNQIQWWHLLANLKYVLSYLLSGDTWFWKPN